MKEITRIHIAKVAYDIELGAKKDIEQYMAALERYANDPDILDDIEIRVTELLTERGVQAGGVIAEGDVAAVRAQLGEPSDFASEDAEPVGETLEPSVEQARRIYRDTDNAMLGGVLAGFAKFFTTDPLWLRLLFVLVLLGSFGTALIVYLVLWLVIPPAETAAEKLRMSGHAVTLASIKELVKREDGREERSQAMRRVVSVIGGSFLILIAISGLLAIVTAIAGVGWAEYSPVTDRLANESWWFMPMMGLFILSGLLFSALFFILASAVFQRKWSKRVSTAVIAIIAIGLVVFVGGAGLGTYGYASMQERIADLTKVRSIEPAAEISGVKKLHVTAGTSTLETGAIDYFVSDNPRFEMSGLPGVEPIISVSDDGETMEVRLVKTGQEAYNVWGYLATPTLTIYGPALSAIEVDSGHQAVRYYNNGQVQDTLRVVGESGSFSLVGTYKNLHVTSKNSTAISLGDAAIENLEVDLSGGSVTVGVIRALTVKQSDVCPAREYHDVRGSLQVQAVSSGRMKYNDKDQVAASKQTACGAIIIGDDNPQEEVGDDL